MLQKKAVTDLLIIIPPARMRHSLWAPLGSMYIASALKQRGYETKILDVQLERITDTEVIDRIKQINPQYIGYSGMVATNYEYIKNLSHKVKIAFPNKIQILGGGLSYAAKVVLQNTPIDIVVYGEGEITIVELLYSLNNHLDLNSVSGIYYKKDSRCIFTGKRPLIPDIDTIPYPAFDLVNMEQYLPDAFEIFRPFTNIKLNKKTYDKNRKRRMINIITSRGCIGKCTFCAKQDAGLRMHSMKYIFDFIEYCKEKFDVDFFSFGDECFAPTKKRNWEFINEYKRRNSDIIFRILGLRVATVDEDILRAYKEIGCIMINYGFESGSQKMLNIIDKGVTVEQNRKTALWTGIASIYTPPQLILGMPGETNETIQETIDFLKSLDFYEKQYKFTYALPIPGSHLYNYARLTKAIEDEDKYLSTLGEIEGTNVFHINLTDEEDSIVAGWRDKINKETYNHYYYKKYKIKNPTIKKCIHFFESIEFHIRGKDLLSVISRKLRLLFFSILNINQKKLVIEGKYCQFRKKNNISFEGFLKGADCSSLNRNISLRKINEKLSEAISCEVLE